MRPGPRGLFGQLALLTLGAFLAAQAINLWLFTDERGAAIRAAQRLETIERASAVAEVLQMAPVGNRDSILAAANSRLVRFSLAGVPLVATDSTLSPPATGLRTQEVAMSPHGGEMVRPPPPMSWLHERMGSELMQSLPE